MPIGYRFGQGATGKIVKGAVTRDALAPEVAAAVTRQSGDIRLTDFDPGGAIAAGTDATNVLNDALAALYAVGGGTLLFPSGNILIGGQIVLPNDGGGGGGSGAQKQPPMMWRGTGAHASGQNESGTGGTRLICTYASATYNDAKFVTRGLGQWVIEGITFEDTMVGAVTPFVFTTNTTIKINRCAFLGASVGTACQQDAIVLGGTTKPIATGYDDPNSAFQGYGTVISDCYFNGVRRVAYGRSYANQVQIVHNMMDKNCGSNLVGGTCIEFDGSLDPETTNEGDYCTNPLVMGNYMHAVYYTYGVKLKKTYRANIIANGFIDPGASCVAVVRCEGTTVGATNYPSFGNLVMGNTWTDADVIELSEDALSSGKNTLFASSKNPGTVIPGNITLVGDLNPIKAGRITFVGGDTRTIIQPDAATGSPNSPLLVIRRSAAESSNPGQNVMSFRQSGGIFLNGIGPGVFFGSEAGVPSSSVQTGVGNPEGRFTSVPGGLFLRTDGGAGSSLYVKESGTGNTGWVAK